MLSRGLERSPCPGVIDTTRLHQHQASRKGPERRLSMTRRSWAAEGATRHLRVKPYAASWHVICENRCGSSGLVESRGNQCFAVPSRFPLEALTLLQLFLDSIGARGRRALLVQPSGQCPRLPSPELRSAVEPVQIGGPSGKRAGAEQDRCLSSDAGSAPLRYARACP